MGKRERISDEQLAAIKAATDIRELIAEHTEIRGRVAVCPFHDDRSPSLAIHERIQRWTCYTCGAKGDCFEFLARLPGGSFLKAVGTLADRAGITVSGVKTEFGAAVSVQGAEKKKIARHVLRCQLAELSRLIRYRRKTLARLDAEIHDAFRHNFVPPDSAIDGYWDTLDSLSALQDELMRLDPGHRRDSDRP